MGHTCRKIRIYLCVGTCIASVAHPAKLLRKEIRTSLMRAIFRKRTTTKFSTALRKQRPKKILTFPRFSITDSPPNTIPPCVAFNKLSITRSKQLRCVRRPFGKFMPKKSTHYINFCLFPIRAHRNATAKFLCFRRTRSQNCRFLCKIISLRRLILLFNASLKVR